LATGGRTGLFAAAIKLDVAALNLFPPQACAASAAKVSVMANNKARIFPFIFRVPFPLQFMERKVGQRACVEVK
jgi:hypothetical protein